MNKGFHELVDLAKQDPSRFQGIPRQDILDAARAHATERRAEIRVRHAHGEAGVNVVRMLSDTADELVQGVFQYALAAVYGLKGIPNGVALCALGSYGRSELSPFSDLDVCLVSESDPIDEQVRLNEYLVPFLWDLGFPIGYVARTLEEACGLAVTDRTGFTSTLQARLLAGDNMVFARLKLYVQDICNTPTAKRFIEEIVRDRYENLPERFHDLYTPAPNIKEGEGGLRDFHAGLWLFMVGYGTTCLDDIAGQGLITSEEHLELVEALDFLWRARNEMHFHAGRCEDTVTFAMQEHLARVLGFEPEEHPPVTRLMEDYYAAARTVRAFLRHAARTWNYHLTRHETGSGAASAAGLRIRNGEICAGEGDANWFARNPSRIMEVYRQCARYDLAMNHATERRITQNRRLIGESFQTSETVRRLFVDICNRPRHAGKILRHMANTGVLSAYIPEFEAVRDIIRYKDFHHYPVHEHTLRAIEALGAIPEDGAPVHRCLQVTIEHLSDPFILVMAVLFHDLGKAAGEVHEQESERLARRICGRMNMSEDDTSRIAFLVRHHTLMTHLSQYRDIDDEDILESFAATMRTEQRLRALFLLSYADLSAVGPNVWNQWKGTLLMRLYLQTEKILLGRAESEDIAFWESPKAQEVHGRLPASRRAAAEDHIRAMGDRYLAAFSPEDIALHIEGLERVNSENLVIFDSADERTGTSEIVVITTDRLGLFYHLAGSFAAELADVNNAKLFTRPDGLVIDCFSVTDAKHRRPLTTRQIHRIGTIMKHVLFDGGSIQAYVDQAKRGLFALLQPHIPVRTLIAFDNESSQTHTVIDVETGDRTGLLYDISRIMSGLELDILSARIVTDARRVRDAFYVTRHGCKVEDADAQQTIREALHSAIHPRAGVEMHPPPA